MMKLKEGMAIHCKNRGDAYLFLKECERQGIGTCAGNLATRLYDIGVWEQNEEKTCFGITLESNHNDYSVNKIVGFSDEDFYNNENGFEVIEFNDFFKGEYEMEEEFYFENEKIIKLVVKLTDGNRLILEGNEVVDMPEIIEQKFHNKDEFITFGYMGIRRDLIEWYKIEEIN